MSQWLHWWLSSLYFVVSHKGICSQSQALPFPNSKSKFHQPLSLLRPFLNVTSINSEFKNTHAYPQCMYHIQISSRSSYVSIYTYSYPLHLRLPRRCHTQKPANVAMRDPARHDVVTAASAPTVPVPKKVPPRANGSSNHGGNHGETEENEVFSFWILGVFSD